MAFGEKSFMEKAAPVLLTSLLVVAAAVGGYLTLSHDGGSAAKTEVNTASAADSIDSK